MPDDLPHHRHPADEVLSQVLDEVVRLRDELRSEPFPPSSDLAELDVDPYTREIVMRCLVCGEDLPGEIGALNEALVVWREHRREMRKHA